MPYCGVGKRITTNIVTGETEVTSGFGLIESWEIVRRSRGGRMVSVAVTLSEGLYRAVLSKLVLALSREYFQLRKPLERRVYALARKHCGRQNSWLVSVVALLKKSGSASPRRVFLKMFRVMIAAAHLPDYEMREEPGDLIRFSLRSGVIKAMPVSPPNLSAAALDKARLLMLGADVYALEVEWRGVWNRTGRTRLHSPDGAFPGWVKKRAGG